MLKHYTSKKIDNLDDFLPQVTCTYNTNVQKTNKFSPFYLLYHREARLPLDMAMKLDPDFSFGKKYLSEMEDIRDLVKQRIGDSQSSNKVYYDKNHRDVQFEEGDMVSLYTPQTEVGLS